MTTCQKKGCKLNVLMDGFCVRHLKQKCSICLEDVPSTNSASHKRLSCGHAFHFRCILNWFVCSNECPSCRTKQISDPLIKFKEKVESEMRRKYKEAIQSLESENRRLTRGSS